LVISGRLKGGPQIGEVIQYSWKGIVQGVLGVIKGSEDSEGAPLDIEMAQQEMGSRANTLWARRQCTGFEG
jgi:hypothetical protein